MIINNRLKEFAKRHPGISILVPLAVATLIIHLFVVLIVQVLGLNINSEKEAVITANLLILSLSWFAIAQSSTDSKSIFYINKKGRLKRNSFFAVIWLLVFILSIFYFLLS